MKLNSWISFDPVFGLILFGALSLAPGPAEASSWTGWLGPDQAGRAQGFETPDFWPGKLRQNWRVEVGEGYSTPLVVGERSFQHAREGDDEVLWCLDRKTGEALWRKSMPIEFVAGRNGERHGLGPKSTPAYADGRVFTLSITGTLTAWAAEDGELLWSRDFRENFEVTHPYWGTASSPVAEGDRVFAHTGSCEDGALFCIDAKTGKDIWTRTEEATCYSSPRIETIDGVRQLVELNHEGLCGIDMENGELLWKSSFPHRGNNQNVATPARIGNMFVVGGENRQTFGVRVGKTDGEWHVERVWQHRDAALEMSSPIVHDGLLYGFSVLKTGQFFCLDPATGTMKWTGEARMGDNAQLLSLPGCILTLTDDGSCRILRATGEKFDVIRNYQVADDHTWAAPALVDDMLLIKEKNHLSSWAIHGEDTPSGARKSDLEKAYAAQVTRVDSDVGELLDTLRELGIDQNTLVIFSGDNGSSFPPESKIGSRFNQASNGLRGYKRGLYEGALRQAAISWRPGSVPAGRVDDQPWAFWDLMPTFVELSGATPPPGYETDGLSLRSYLTPEIDGKGNMFDNTVIVYLPNNGETHHSRGTEWPFLIVAGNNTPMSLGRRYMRFPNYGDQGHKTIDNLYTTILNVYGNPVEHYGAIDMELERFRIDQKGPIKELLI